MMDIEIIKKDAKDLEAILNKIKDNMNNIPNGLSHHDYMKLYNEKNADLITTYNYIEKKYMGIFDKANLTYDPPYESQSIREYLRFFITLYDQINTEAEG